MAIVVLKPRDYQYPLTLPKQSQPKVKPTVVIDGDELFKTVQLSAASWEQLSDLYVVDIDTLKKHFTLDYNQACAKHDIEIHAALRAQALEGNGTALKILAINRLKMSDKVINITEEENGAGFTIKVISPKERPITDNKDDVNRH